MISLLLAMDENRVIGKDNQLPWHLPADLQYFKKITMGHAVVMGRKTYDSIGRLLPGRENVIVTRNAAVKVDGARILHSVSEIEHFAAEQDGEVFVIGGAEIFKGILPKAERVYMTLIRHSFEGDTYFPELDGEWTEISRTAGKVDEANRYPHDFLVFERKITK